MSTLSVSDRAPIIISATALAVLVLMALLLAGAPLYTDDLWWHLKAGEMYVTDGPWPEADWMLHTARDDAPIQHEWLFGVSVFALEWLLGFQGLRVVHAVAVALIIWMVFSLFRRACAWPAAACFATCVFIVLAWFRLFQFRPDLVSIIATLLGYRLLLASGDPPSRQHIAAYVVLVTVWANFHSLFLVGLNLVLAAMLGVAMGAFMDRAARVGEPGSEARAARRRRLATGLGVALGLGLAATLLNPRGIDQHLTFLSSTQHSAIWRVTDEWSHFHPFDFNANHHTITLPMWLAANGVLVAFLLSAATAFVRFSMRRTAEALNEFDAVGFGLAVASIVAFLVSIRFLWMCVFPLLYVLHAFRWLNVDRFRTCVGATWLMAVASVVLAAWFSVGYGFGYLAARFGLSPGEYFSVPFRTHKFHSEGVHFLAASRLEGNLFNSYGMGGFLGYWLSPRLRTFVDSRAEHYDSVVYLDYSAVTKMRGRKPGETFVDVLDRRNVDVFFGIGFPGWWHPVYTTTHLDGVDGWLLVSRSFRHAIYLRDDARNRKNMDRVANWYEAEGVPFDRDRGLDPSSVIRQRPDWAIEHSMLPTDYRELLADSTSSDPETQLKVRNALGLVYLMTGAVSEQIDWDKQTAKAFPRDRRSRQRLVYALLRIDKPREAQSIVNELLDIDSTDRWSRDLAKLVRKYRRFGRQTGNASVDRALQVRRNYLLWKKLPATVAETWAVELAMATENLEISPVDR